MTDAIAIFGPTASGKSALAVDLARKLGGVVINADALQVYRDLRIVTARPTDDQETQAPHRLYGVFDAAETCSAGRWRALALEEIARARSLGLRPILVGGTGLYLKALVEGIATVPPIPDEVRQRVRARLERLGAASLQVELALKDPAGAERIGPHNGQRLARALEVIEATGRPLSAWQAEAHGVTAPRMKLVALMPPRPSLDASIAARLESMIEHGALAEIEALLARNLDPRLSLMKAVAVRELSAHVRGKCSLEDALEAAKVATRRYAKRQETWMRGQLMTRTSNFIAHCAICRQYSAGMLRDILPKMT